MISAADKLITWQLVHPTARKKSGETIHGNLELVEIPVPAMMAGDVLVAVAGCVVSPSDLGQYFDGISIERPPALPFGHDIAGTVVGGDPFWVGKEVVVAAVLPCGTCRHCRNGHSDRCLNPRTLKNSSGVHGGFASHIVLPGFHLCEIKHCKGIPLEHFAVVPGAVATAYQAVSHASLKGTDNVVVIGAGGIGAFIVQIAKALGAGTVFVVDGVESRLNRMLTYGADASINDSDKKPFEIVEEANRICRASNRPDSGWKIFEAAGSTSGRETASAFLYGGGKLITVATSTADDETKVDNVGKLDSEIIRVRGCLPEHYPRILEMVTSGRIAVSPFVLTRPMSWIRDVFDELHKNPGVAQYILTPDDFGLDTDPEPKSCR